MGFVSPGFARRRQPGSSDQALPPGQYDVGDGFPVLSAGPTPHTPTDQWDFAVTGEVGAGVRLSWDEFSALPHEDVTVDIHCVTKWSKFATNWRGVPVETLLDAADTSAEYVLAFCDGGYTTNVPVEDLVDGKAWVVDTYEGEPLEPEHGGPVRLLVPHLYFWKSAKWLRGLQLSSFDEPGFWESLGYHIYGDPWQEQRYSGD